ncbi:MAG: sugar phosphate isomerase/epimerase [Actinomycetota bacterium]|nr:sugar phosphate isomerase/epimerase [Actinomycetota bacterium]
MGQVEADRQLPRLAFSTLAFPSQSLAEAAAFGRRSGYEGIELRLVDGELIDPAMSGEERRRVKRDVGGLPVVAVDSSVRLTEEGPVPQIKAFLELANDWEAPAVRVFGGKLPEGVAERRRALEEAAKVLEEVAPLAERLGVAVGLETHDSFSASSVVAELLDLVPSRWVGAVWDSHHPHRMGETPAEVYANIGARLVLAQVKDARKSDSEPSGWQLVLMGEGEVPVRDMLAVLAGGGYSGVVSVEWEKRWHPEIEEPWVALPQHIEVLKPWVESAWAAPQRS